MPSFNSPLFRRRLSHSNSPSTFPTSSSSSPPSRLARPHSPLDFKDPSINLLSPTGSGQFVSLPIVDHHSTTAPGLEFKVPLTPRDEVLNCQARFGEDLNNNQEVSREGNAASKEENEVKVVEVIDQRQGGFVEKVKLWMIYEGPQWVWFAVWILLQSLVFAFGVLNYGLKDNLTTARATFGKTYIIARSAALVLHVDVAFILLPICRGFVSRLRRSTLNELVPFEKNIEFHKLVAWSIVFWTIVHTLAHLVNFWLLAVILASNAPTRLLAYLKANLTTGPGATGWAMIVFLAVMVFFALDGRRKRHFERFYFSHHLFIPFFVCWQFHGMFCMIKPDRPPFCSYQIVGVFWKYAIVGIIVYVLERILREIRSRHRTWITAVIQHPSEVVEIQFKKEKTKIAAGQYIMLNCPEISFLQWHPFSITSAPEEDFISVHIRVVGDYTRALAETLGCRISKRGETPSVDEGAQIVSPFSRILPRIMIDGPFGSASEDVFDFEVSVLVAGGIGVTPFASVLKHIWYRLNTAQQHSTRLRKVYFFWICRDFTSFKWFQSLLMALEAQDTANHIEIHTYLTKPLKLDDVENIITNDVGAKRDALTRLRAPTHYGRPNFNQLFPSIARTHQSVSEIGVFFCGPKPMAINLEQCCKKFSQPGEDGTRFVWRKENF